MKVYLVGGAVRDQLLGVADENTEKDWVVVGASAVEMRALGYRQVGSDFPVFLHPKTHEEYALARTERKIGVGYTGFEFDSTNTVTLKQDLCRRDLTINAMAMDAHGRLIDPFDGQADLNNGLLRHVSDAFTEDPVRILRVARFAARFERFGFKVAHKTHQLMRQMVACGEVDALTPERVFKELNRALSCPTPSAFFKVLSACGAYEKVFFPLKQQLVPAHGNYFTPLDNLATEQPALKFACWLYAETLDDINLLCQRMRCPKQYHQLACLTAQFYVLAKHFSQQSVEAILDFFQQTDALRRKDRFDDLLAIFALLQLDITPIVQLRDLLGAIDVSVLDKENIAVAIRQKKQAIIRRFLR